MTRDTKKGAEGKPEKRPLTLDDIRALRPFHWAYEFDEIIVNRGGFDAIITNPPWEVFETSEKQFSIRYESTIQKNSIPIEEWTKMFAAFMKQREFREAWLEYASGFPHVSLFFKNSAQFRRQISVIDGRQVATKINLYKNFTEQSHNLLRVGGRCGLVVPSGIYTDLGATRLREMLFSESETSAIFGLSNEKFLFEEVHHAFKFCLIAFAKGGQTALFRGAFRINPREAISTEELGAFLHSTELHFEIKTELVRRLSPGSFSVMEFKSAFDVSIAEKLLRHPPLGEERTDVWNVAFTQEFNMTTDSDLFENAPAKNRLPLFEGKMLWQFECAYAEPRYWINERAARERILGRTVVDEGQTLAYQGYRLGYREISANTNERTLVCAFLPRRCFANHKVILVKSPSALPEQLYVAALLNSLVSDFMIRMKVTTSVSMFFVYQLPIPRLTAADPAFRPLVERAARLVGTTAVFDDLLKEIFGPRATHRTHGEPTPAGRARLRAEIDAQVAHLYDLTEAEFTHILGTFPLVPAETKAAALAAFRQAPAP